ncbi:GNAT family N-acetyltransferase [Raineyella sp.]|uniref:GNAT family N-acetyltransferase n=1 Tax=Raineyella sp. TaxID=1911550 RepID=UPI002B20E2D0|nr:GNAT family N-acetyltransferase [Raineyella sp.]MEA5155263.1 GNAT family N-acetyltransferase [Raineyella sp.]
MNPPETPARAATQDLTTPVDPSVDPAPARDLDGPTGEVAADVLPLAALTTAGIIEVYDELLRPSFRPEELLSIGEVLRVYAGADPAPSGVVLRDGHPLGIHLCERFVGGEVLLLSYLAVSSQARGGGIGSVLLDDVSRSRVESGPGAVVLAEVDDPRVWPATPSTGDPVARLRFYGRRGARLLPMSFTQPQLQPGVGRVPGMFLIRLDQQGDPAPDLLTRFVTEYYTECEGPEALDDPTLRTMLAAAGQIDLDRDLLPMTDWERLPQVVVR